MKSTLAPQVAEEVICYHCGQPCNDEILKIEDKSFCCFGCQTVYQILSENDLCEYYLLDKNAGVSLRHVAEDSYQYLDEPAVKSKLLEFDSPAFSRVQFFIPSIHCISCLWLLENLRKIHEGVIKAEVSFARKSVRVDFDPQKITLGKLAHLLATLGYAPYINLDSEVKPSKTSSMKPLITRLAVAGFCFGNIMLFSFPEYLGLEESDAFLKSVFSYLNIVLALPVIAFSAKDYFTASWRSFQQKEINIDVPIALGLAALFLRSIYDIISATGPGYMDSLAGLVFFLLIGRWFQGKTYESLAFDRDFKSYFPLAVNCWMNDKWTPVLIYHVKKGDRLRIRNMEIFPSDAFLLHEKAYVDYSFVTGESRPVEVSKGGLIYAGGRLVGAPVEVCVDKETSQSYLTSLWNNAAFTKPDKSKYNKIIDVAARRFTWIVLVIALITAVAWFYIDSTRMWLVLTSVLMVACPCALALATPFTYGSMLRVFGRRGFYLKNADVVEKLASIDTIVFDKTGTITHGSGKVDFIGKLEDHELKAVIALASSSTHPLSSLIVRSHDVQKKSISVTEFKEWPGKGIEGRVDDLLFKMGSGSFVGSTADVAGATRVFVSVNGAVKGYFHLDISVRNSIPALLKKLGDKVFALLSGDNEAEREKMLMLFGEKTRLLFNQTPHDKLHYVSDLQKEGKHVMMIGDGLNDSGALKQSDVGVAISDDKGIFTPACDAILDGQSITQLDQFLKLAQKSALILKAGFVISFAYNFIALSIAVSGHLTPLIAAILMPVSSISVVGFTTGAVNLSAGKMFSKRSDL